MAKLAEYGIINYTTILDGDTHFDAIQSIIGLCAYPIIEDSQMIYSTSIIAYEKSFWSKKEKGFINLEYIENAKLDLTKISINEDKVIPKHADVLIGFSVNSEYEKFKVPGSIKIYEIGQPRKQLLSYGKLIAIIEEHCNYYTQILLDELRSMSPLDNMEFSSTHRAAQNLLDEFRLVKSKLAFFEKYI